MQGATMSADADHEVIDSTEALFRHLYEEHGVEEARDLDPETAPLQFWLRRHADLERAQRAARRPDPPPERAPEPPPEPPAPPPPPPPRGEARPQPAPASLPRGEARPQPAPPAGAGREGRSQAPPFAPTGREGRRPAPFADPLVEAVARALAGRGHGEAAVRSAMRSFAGDGAGPPGEAAVRSVFVEPMLQAVAERLLDAPPPRRHPPPSTAAPPPRPTADSAGDGPAPPRSRPVPGPDPAPTPAAAGEEPSRPEAAWAVLWADLADTGRRPGGAGPGEPDDDGDDLMAVANAVQTRRRGKRRRR
jgi:hypothetical protein